MQGRAAVRRYWERQFAAISSQVEPERFYTEKDGSVTVDVRQVVRDATTGSCSLTPWFCTAFGWKATWSSVWMCWSLRSRPRLRRHLEFRAPQPVDRLTTTEAVAPLLSAVSLIGFRHFGKPIKKSAPDEPPLPSDLASWELALLREVEKCLLLNFEKLGSLGSV